MLDIWLMSYDIIEFTENLWAFLFTEIPFLSDLIGQRVDLWILITGLGFGVIFIAWLTKKLVPVA